MATTKEVTFINVDPATGLFYEDTVTATVLDGTESTLAAGVYVVEGNVNLEHLTTNDDVKIILADGCSCTVSGVAVSGALTVYGQKNGSGTLTSTADGDFSKAGIQLNTGDTFTMASGIVNAYGANGGAGIGGGSSTQDISGITIWGGYVNAKGSGSAAGIGSCEGSNVSDITINGGTVTAESENGGAGIGAGKGGTFSNITINGGLTQAGGDSTGAGIGAGAQAPVGSQGVTVNNGLVSTYSNNRGAGIGTGVSGKGQSGVYAVRDIYINGGYVNAGSLNGTGSAIGVGDSYTGSSDWDVVDLYVSSAMDLYVGSKFVEHDDDQDLSKTLAKAETVYATATHRTYQDIPEGYTYLYLYESISDRGYAGFEIDMENYALIDIGGGYVYVTDNMGLVCDQGLEFSNISVNGDIAHGGVICAEEDGGFIYLRNLTFSDNKVIHNGTEAAGGAIYSNGAHETILTRCDFTDNMASGYRQRSYGGAVAVTGEAMLTVKDAVFSGNKATSEGGAVWNNYNFLITGSDFINGYADKGGAVYAASETQEDSKRIVNSTFEYNTANFGGAVYVDTNSFVSIEKSVFNNNNAHTYGYEIKSGAVDPGDHRGGAVYVAGDKDARQGGAAVISNIGFTGNYAKQGGALYVDSYADVAVSYADFINNTAAEEGGAIFVAQYGTLALGDVYFNGNVSCVADPEQQDVVLTQYCAVYNEGEINLIDHVEVDAFALDVLYNRGRVNWDTNGMTANGFFSDITLFTNEVTDGNFIGSFGITVNANDLEGVSRYVLAENAVFDNMPEETAMSLKRFVLRGVAGEADKVIVADGDAVEYNGKTYRLYTTDAAHYNQLILAVEPGKTGRTSHIVVDKENFDAAELTASGEFKDFKYSTALGGAVLVTKDAVFSAHDSVFSGNEGKEGGAIYAESGSNVNLTNVTFAGNTSLDGESGALYIAADATVTMYGDVVLSTASDTVANYGTLVWNIGINDNGYISDYSLLNNAVTSSLVIDNTEAVYGTYRLADNALSADGATFRLTSGGSDTITVNSEDWVSCGTMEARVYVDADQKNSLWLEVRAHRIDVELATYTMRGDYTVDMTDSPSYDGDGGLIYVHSNGRLANEDSVKITGAYATGNGGAVYSEGNIKLSKAEFTGNYSYMLGGAIYGAGIKLTLTDSVFSGNVAGEGGAIYNEDGKTILDNVTFNGNTAIAGHAGAIYGGDIDLVGSVYLVSETDTIYMESGKELNWTIDGNKSGYLSHFTQLTGDIDEETFTIDAEDALAGHCYTLAGSAYSSNGQTFTITCTGADGAEVHTMKVNGEAQMVNDVRYSLTVNDADELCLSVYQHLEVDYEVRIDSVQDFSCAGTDIYMGNGSLFEIKANGVMTNMFYEEEGTRSYAASFSNGTASEAGGMIYNEGRLTLDGVNFEANKASNGGAIYSKNEVFITGGSFTANTSMNDGGAVYIAGGNGNYLSGTFENNSAQGNGGAVYVAAGAALTLGDATFKGNEAEDEGGAIYNEGSVQLTGELVLSSSDDSFFNYGTVTLDYASGASIVGYQYLMSEDDSKVCISVAGLEAGQEIFQYEFAKGDFGGDYAYVDEFTLTDGTSETTISVGGDPVKFNGLNYTVTKNETADALVLNAYTEKTISVTLRDTTKLYDGLELNSVEYTVAGMQKGDELVFTLSDTITDAGSVKAGIGTWQVLRDGVDVSYEYKLTSNNCTLTVIPRYIVLATGNAVKVYDGTPLTSDTATVYGDGFVLGEGWHYEVTGSQSQVGHSANTFQYTFDEGTKAQNYRVIGNLGVLAVNAVNSTDITIVVDNLTKMYDGRALEATYQYDRSLLAEGDELVVKLDCTDITDAGKVTVSVVDYRVIRGTEDVTSGYTFATSVSGSLEITQRNILVTTGDAQKVYDGTALTNDAVTIAGDGFARYEDWTYAVTGSQTDVGISDNTFEYTFSYNTKAQNYNVIVDPGTLKVYSADEKITITVDNLTKMYDGKALEATYSYTQGILLEGDELVVLLSTDSIVDVTESTEVTVIGYKVLRDGADVTAEYAFADSVAGSLEVTKRNILVTTGDAQKLYDGTPLTNDTVFITGDEFALNEGWNYEITGNQMETGLSDNTFEYMFNEGTKAENYNITVAPGKLKVYTADEVITITVDNLSKMYDGKALEATYSYTQGILLAGDELVVTLSTDSITDVADSTAVTVTGYKVLRDGVDVTREYAFAASVAGSLEVTKRNIQVATGSAQKLYDGTALTNGTAAITGDGFVSGEGWNYAVTGSQRTIGVSANTFEYAFNEGTKAQNYNVVVDPGKLQVYTAATGITIMVDNLTKMYDGKALEATYTYTQGILKAGDELVVTLSTDSIVDVTESTAVSVTGYKVLRNGADVTNEYAFADSVAGSLGITKRNIQVVTSNAQKLYDGTALTSDAVAVTGDGFAAGESWNYKTTGSQTEIGFSDNTFEYAFGKDTKAQNYNVTVELGKLKVYGVDEVITVTVDNLSKMYDGTALEATYSYTQGVLKVGDELVITLSTDSITNVTESTEVTVTGCKVLRDGADVTNEYVFADAVSGSLEITQREITLTSGSKSKTYDGTSVSDTSITVSGKDGYVEGEELSYSNFAELTEVGYAYNTFQYGSNDTTKVENYNVTVENGVLTVYDAADLYVKGIEAINTDMEYASIAVQADSTLLIERTATIAADVIVYNGNNGLIATGNSRLSCNELYVKGSGNKLEGLTAALKQVEMKSDADLSVNMDQFDQMIADASFMDNNNGTLIVAPSDNNALLEQSDINAVINKLNLSNIDFEMDLLNINKLTFNAAQAKNIEFNDAYGTSKSDTIRFAKNSVVSFGQEGKVIDLAEGKNTVQIDKNSAAAIKSDLKNVSTVKSSTGTVVEVGNIDFQDGRSASLTANGTSFAAGSIEGSDKKTTVTIGKKTAFSAADVAGVDSIKLGACGSAQFGKLDGVNSLKASSGSYSKKTAETSWTKLTAAAVTGTEGKDSVSFGSYNDATLDSLSLGDGSDTLTIGSYSQVGINGSLDFGEGAKDTLSIGKGATLSVDKLDVENLDKLTMGKDSCLAIADADDLAAAKEKWSKYSDLIIAKIA